MNIMALDLEMNQPSGKIVQVGYCIANIITEQITQYPGIYVTIDEPMSDYIIKLCHIDMEKYEKEKVTLQEAYLIMANHYTINECRMNAITWGGGDTECLRKQLNMEDMRWVFGRRWVDTKTIAQSYFVANGKSHPGGLSKSMSKIGLQFQGTKHDAADDAFNTMRVYLRLLNKLKEK